MCDNIKLELLESKQTVLQKAIDELATLRTLEDKKEKEEQAYYIIEVLNGYSIKIAITDDFEDKKNELKALCLVGLAKPSLEISIYENEISYATYLNYERLGYALSLINSAIEHHNNR